MIKLFAALAAVVIAAGGTVAAVAGATGGGSCAGQTVTPSPNEKATVPGDDSDADLPPDVDVRALRAAGTALRTAPTSGADAGRPDGPAPVDTDGSEAPLPSSATVGGGGIACLGGGVGGTGWDAGNIIADAVFYDSTTMDAAAIATFLAGKGEACTSNCLKDRVVDTTSQSADAYCLGYAGRTGQPVAEVFAAVSASCGINPQVLLVMLEKESSLVTATSPAASRYAAAFGYACPDSGPGDSASCNGADAGLWQQTWGFAHQLAKYKVEIPQGRIGRYQPGETVDILWNVAASGCGSAPVTIANLATASLYTYTPYQPNQAAIDAYPGTGDECSSYGNRNFFFLFQDWFGPTGGGAPAGSSVTDASGSGPLGPTKVQVSGTAVTIPTGATVPAAVAGQLVTAPTPEVAAAIAAGMTWLGTPYSWGGGAAPGPSLGICAPGPAQGDCHIVGFDCSGLTSYVAARFGARLPRHSGDQRDPSHGVPRPAAQPGDLVGYPGHIAVYLGQIGGVDYMLEAPESGRDIQIRPVRPGADSAVYRYWNAAPSAG